VIVPPWLSHLPTDRRGLPVPWVNAWGPEDPSRVRIDRELLPWNWGLSIDSWGMFIDDDRDAGPDFTRQEPGRQRRAVLEGLCQVCARPVPWSRRWLVVAGLSVERIEVDGRSVPVVVEPWLCQRCAEFAVTVCPALIRRTREEDLTLVEVTSKRQVEVFMSRGWVEGALEAESRRLRPFMWAKIALTGVRIEATAARTCADCAGPVEAGYVRCRDCRRRLARIRTG
jgi:hypothetical protein